MVARGIISESVTIENNGGSLSAEVFPSAYGPLHDFTAFDGVLDFAGTSGATDTVSGATVQASTTGPTAQVLESFSGNSEIFLTLSASTFPLVQGMDNEAVEDTANGTANVTLTYDYTPVAATPEPAAMSLLAVGLGGLLWICYRRRRARSVCCNEVSTTLLRAFHGKCRFPD